MQIKSSLLIFLNDELFQRSQEVIHISTRFLKKCLSGPRKTDFCFLIFVHAWLILNYSKVSLPLKILKIEFLTQLLAKQKEKYKLYLCWANGFGNWPVFGVQVHLQNKAFAAAFEHLAKVKQVIWWTMKWCARRIDQKRCSLFHK